MRILELFSGTGSVGKVFRENGHHVISLDIENSNHSNRHIKVSILDWDYTEFAKGHFDYIHASPPCNTFSQARKSWINREVKAHPGIPMTMDMIIKDQLEIGLPLLNKTLEIINYFDPKYFTIENPQTGDMKKYITDIPFTDVNYCQYDLPYKKTTRIWNNFNFVGLKCNKDCKFLNGKKHTTNCDNLSLKQRYRIPKDLVISIMNQINNE